jgi:AcrR family transcriptional regulator
MPKAVDPLIRNEILESAERLLDRGSERAVTMRALSDVTGIAVTTIYDRFEGHEGLLRALAERFALDEVRRLSKWHTIEEVFEHYLDYAQAKPHRYKLIVDTFWERLGRTEKVAGLELVKSLLAERLGGAPEDHEELGLGVIELMAGTVTAIMTAGKQVKFQKKARCGARAVLNRALANGRG